MPIRFQFFGIKKEPIKIKSLEEKIMLLFLLENKEIGELLVVLTSDEKLLEINKQFLKHDYYTDIITFDYSDNNLISGELYVSRERVKDNADKYKVDYSIELQRVIIHGMLHLIGYSDHSMEEKKIIRKKENYYMSFSL